LHVAAGTGKLEAIPFLIERVVEIVTRSIATERMAPNMLRGRPVTPEDVARNCGEDAYKKWANAIARCGNGLIVPPGDVDWDLENVDGIFGGCECCKHGVFNSVVPYPFQ
jgi:hypothetical protein